MGYKHKFIISGLFLTGKVLRQKKELEKTKISKHVPKLELVYVRTSALKESLNVKTMPVLVFKMVVYHY